MSIRKSLVAVAATLVLLVGAKSDAAFIGSLNFLDGGQPLANGSPTGNIDTASTLTIGDLLSGGSKTGVFVGTPTFTDFGSVTFSTANGANTTFAFGNATFGFFASTLITSVNSGNGVQSFFILGTFTPGTAPGYGGVTAVQPASFTISFTQTPAGGGVGSSISDSGTLSVPPAGAVPEPASFAMVVIGLGGVFAVGRFRRRAA